MDVATVDLFCSTCQRTAHVAKEDTPVAPGLFGTPPKRGLG
jgi:hypothetical protein